MTTETQTEEIETGLTAAEQAIIDDEDSQDNSDELSEEERASLTTAELAIIDGEEGEEGEGTDDDAATLSSEQAAEEAAKAAANNQAQPTAEQLAAEAPRVAQEAELPEVDTSKLIELAESIGTNAAELESIGTQLDELAKQFDEGDIAQGAYDRAKRKLENQEVEVRAKISDDTRAQQQIVEKDASRNAILDQRYQKEFSDYSTEFFAKAENQLFATDQTAFLKLQETINRMGESGMSAGLTAKQTIDAARAHVAISLQLPPSVVSSSNKSEGNKRKTPIDIAPTLNQMNSVIGNGVELGEFAHLEKLKGLAYENALSKMPESQRERYLQG